MNTYIIGIIVLIAVVASIYDMYNLSCLFSDSCEQTQQTQQPDPQMLQPQHHSEVHSTTLNKVSMYRDNDHIKNKGFINELMYKEEDDFYDIRTEELIKPDIPLNRPKCKLSGDLPMANININYLIQKDTAMLR